MILGKNDLMSRFKELKRSGVIDIVVGWGFSESAASDALKKSIDNLLDDSDNSEEECNSYDWGNKSNYIDYEKIYLSRFKILRKAYKRSNIGDSKKFNAYCKKNSWWLDDYALYMSIKDSYEGKPWIEWDEEIRERKEDALLSYKRDLEEEIEF